MQPPRQRHVGSGLTSRDRSAGAAARRGPRRGQAPYVGAAVAVGSTSVHFTAARLDPTGLQVVGDASAFLSLGWVVDREGGLPSQVRTDLVDVLLEYKAQASALGAASLTLVATEPLRRASNAAEVADAVREATGEPLHVLTHDEEGLLALLAVTGGDPPVRPLLLVDVGGGSTEFVVAGNGGQAATGSLNLGAARLTVALVESDPPTPHEIEALRTRAGEAVGRVELQRIEGNRRPAGGRVVRFPARPPDRVDAAVFVGGTATNLTRIVPAATGDGVLTHRRLLSAYRTLGRMPAAEIAGRFGVTPLRARILPGGAAIVEAVMARYGVARAQVSQLSLREGVILVVARAGAAWRERLPELLGGGP